MRLPAGLRSGNRRNVDVGKERKEHGRDKEHKEDGRGKEGGAGGTIADALANAMVQMTELTKMVQRQNEAMSAMKCQIASLSKSPPDASASATGERRDRGGRDGEEGIGEENAQRDAKRARTAQRPKRLQFHGPKMTYGAERRAAEAEAEAEAEAAATVAGAPAAKGQVQVSANANVLAFHHSLLELENRQLQRAQLLARYGIMQ